MDELVVKQERYDPNMMEDLLTHDGISEDDKRKLRSYKKKREDGNMVQVVYEYGKKVKDLKMGRLYPQKNIGLQTFPSNIRSALAGSLYDDVDMVNSQPTILLDICEKNGWVCTELKEYVSNRAEKLSEIMEEMDCDREKAKQLCLITMFGGHIVKPPTFIKKLANELKPISQNLVSSRQDLLKLGDANTIVAHILQDKEFTILKHIDAFFRENGRHMDVYIHDGGLVKKDGEFPETLLRQTEQSIFDKFQIKIKLDIKPMKHTFKFKKEEMRFGSVTEKEYNERRSSFEETHFFCKETETICCNNVHYSINKASVTFAEYNFQKRTKKGLETYSFITEWLKDPSKRTVDRIIFDPSKPHGINNSEYNSFTGFRGSSYDGVITSKDQIISVFEELIRIQCGDDEKGDLYEYQKQWYALMIQKPTHIPGVCLISISQKQGVGKDTLGDFIGFRVIGNEYYKNIKNVETELFDTHSTAQDRTIFMKLEEVNGSMTRKNADQLKSIITSTNTTINPKGVKKYTTQVFPHVLMTTNNIVPVKVEEHDRRYCMSYCSTHRYNDREWWNETYRLLELPEAGHVVFQYLMDIPITFNPRDFPKTSYHEMLAESEIPSEQLFIRQTPDFTDLTGGELHRLYKQYCDEQSITPKALVHFSRCLTPLIEEKVITRRKSGVNLYSKVDVPQV